MAGAQQLILRCYLETKAGCAYRKLTTGYTGDVVRPGSVRLSLGRRSERRVGWARPCQAIDACEPRCNILDTIEADGRGAARQTRRHGQGNLGGSNQSTSPHMHSAMATAAQSVDPGCP